MTLKSIQIPIAKQLNSTDDILRGIVKSKVSMIEDVISLVPLTKGKKIRSTILFLLAGMTGTDMKDLPVIASSVELFHLSSLIHDDILDNAKFRRGEKTLNHSFGNLISVLGGDYLFVNSLELMDRIHDKKFLSILIAATKKMVEGQLQEIENNFNYDVTEDVYIQVIEKKTSSLFAGIAKMAAYAGKMDPVGDEEFYRFGINFGNIFQISDDLLDIFSDKSGKDRFRDLEEGKITLPYIILREKYGKKITEFFSIEYREKLLELMDEYDIETEVNKRVEKYYSRCNDFLNKFPPSKYKSSLSHLLGFIKKREF